MLLAFAAHQLLKNLIRLFDDIFACDLLDMSNSLAG
jgi:hypothetical protein